MNEKITKLGVTRSFRAAIVHAIVYQPNDPASMSALDCLEQSFVSLEAMLDLLWKDPDCLDFCNMSSAFGIEYDPMKQGAVLLLTGRSWPDWMKMLEVAA